MISELPAKIVAERSISPERLVGKVGQLSRETRAASAAG